ncbi:MAG: hypothetical protein RSG59_00860 [Ruthenibacterium sp.]
MTGMDRVLLVVIAVSALVCIVSGAANLCGKRLPKASTARVNEADLPAWRKWNAGFNFAIGLALGAVAVVKFVTRGACIAQNSTAMRLMVCVLALLTVLLFVMLYVTKRYTGKMW